MRLYWFFAALIGALVLAFVHIWALDNFLYWQYRWLDTPMHLLGGITIAIFVIALLHSFRPLYFITIVIAVFVAWELFEAWLGINAPSGMSYAFDTAHDLANDGIGAAIVYVLARFSIWKDTITTISASETETTV